MKRPLAVLLLIPALLAAALTTARAEPNLLNLKSGECTFTIFAHDGVKLIQDAAVALQQDDDPSAVTDRTTDRFGKCSFDIAEGRYVLSINGVHVAIVQSAPDHAMTRITVVLPERGLVVGGQDGKLPEGTQPKDGGKKDGGKKDAATAPGAAAKPGATKPQTAPKVVSTGSNSGKIVVGALVLGLVTWGIVEAADDDDGGSGAAAPAASAATAAGGPAFPWKIGGKEVSAETQAFLDGLPLAQQELFKTLDPRFQKALVDFAAANNIPPANFAISSLQPRAKAPAPVFVTAP